jgi:hypothetical protein
MTVGTPVFIVGAERSATTVFGLMLAHHPEITVCATFEYVVDPLVGVEDWPDLDQVHEYLHDNWVFQAAGFQIDPALSYPELASSFLQQQFERGGGPHVVAFVHRHIDQLARIWPDARYIHLVRDPRDVARSVIGMGWAGNVWHGAERWVQVEQTWDRMRGSLPSDRVLELRSEHLILSTPEALTEVCRFIGTDYDPAMLAYDGQSTYDKPDHALVQQWKRKLTPREIGLVEARVGPLLEARGYEASGHPPRPPSALQRLWLRIQNWVSRLRYRVRTQGPGLTLAEYVSRKLGMKRWHARQMKRVDKVRESLLK